MTKPTIFLRPNEQRRPLTAIATRSFWNGVSDIKDVFAAAANASNTEATAQFYIRSAEGERAGDRGREGEEDEAIANDREGPVHCFAFAFQD